MIGVGWKVQVDDGVGSAFADIEKVTEVTPPEDGVVGMAESKTLDISGNTVGRVPTVKTPTNFTFTYEHSKTRYERLEALRGSIKNWKVIDTTPTTPWDIQVPGVLTSHVQQAVAADGIVLVTATVEVTGPAS